MFIASYYERLGFLDENGKMSKRAKIDESVALSMYAPAFAGEDADSVRLFRIACASTPFVHIYPKNGMHI